MTEAKHRSSAKNEKAKEATAVQAVQEFYLKAFLLNGW